MRGEEEKEVTASSDGKMRIYRHSGRPPLHPSMMYFVYWRPTLVVKIIYTQANKTSKVHTQKMPHVCVIAVVFCWA